MNLSPSWPSVIQVRTLDLTPASVGDVVVRALREHAVALEAGALVTLDPASSRVRLLPIKKTSNG